jgi:hypothetical protein
LPNAFAPDQVKRFDVRRDRRFLPEIEVTRVDRSLDPGTYVPPRADHDWTDHTHTEVWTPGGVLEDRPTRSGLSPRDNPPGRYRPIGSNSSSGNRSRTRGRRLTRSEERVVHRFLRPVRRRPAACGRASLDHEPEGLQPPLERPHGDEDSVISLSRNAAI